MNKEKVPYQLQYFYMYHHYSVSLESSANGLIFTVEVGCFLFLCRSRDERASLFGHEDQHRSFLDYYVPFLFS